MEPDASTPLLSTDEFGNGSSDNESNSSDTRSRRARLPFHYPQVHKKRVRREAGSVSIATYQRYRYYTKLADPSIDTLSIPDHIVPPNFFFPFEPLFKTTGKQSSLITIFSIWNTMMGSSLLSMPWAIQQAGFACGLAIMFLMGFLCFYTAYRIVSLRNLAELPNSAVEYPDFCRYLLGPLSEKIATVFSCIPLLGGSVVYWVLFCNFLYFIGVFTYDAIEGHSPINAATNMTYPDVYCPSAIPVNTSLVMLGASSNSTSEVFYTYWNMETTIPFYIAAIFFPLISLKSATFFSKLNALGTLSVIYLIIFVIVKGAKWGIHFNTFDLTSVDYVHLYQVTFPVLVGTLSLSFFIHNCVLSIMRNQKNPENNPRDLGLAYMLVGMTYLVIGGVFFCTFPLEKHCIEDNLLNNFRTSDILAVIARVALIFQILTLYPLVVYILRVQLMHFLFEAIYPGWKPVMILNIFIITLCILFNIYLPKVGTIIRYCGAISGLVYIFTLPCLTYMKALKDKNQLSYVNIFVHSLIVLLGIANLISQFLV